MKYRIRMLHSPRKQGYASGECDSLYIRSGDVSWISERNGIVLVTTDAEHIVRPQVVVDVMKELPGEEL